MPKGIQPRAGLVPPTSERADVLPTTVTVRLPPAFEDARGAIQPLIDAPMKSCVLITSRKGSVRANHYHKTDWHYCYVIEGEIEYYERPVGSSDPPTRTVVRTGELFFTGPMVEHTMLFTEDTTFLTLGGNSRLQASYEADVVRIPPLIP